MSPLRQLQVAAGFLLFLILSGFLFYTFHEGWPLLDALYMVAITISTVGFGEVRPLSSVAKLFNVLFIFLAVITLAWAARGAAELLIQQQFGRGWLRRRSERTLRKMRDHYIICGYGRMGEEIGREFQRQKIPFSVIERDPEVIKKLGESGLPFVEGDATDDEVLSRAGVEQAKGVITVTPSDEDNLFIILSARVLNSGLYIVSRCANQASERKLERAGANRVVSPYVIGARRIATAVLRPAVSDFLEGVMHGEEVELEMEQVEIAAQSDLVGSTLEECAILQKTGVVVVAIVNKNGEIQSQVSGHTRLRQGDTLVVLGTREQLARLDELVKGEPGLKTKEQQEIT